MENLGDRVQQEVRLANLISSVKEADDRGEDSSEYRKEINSRLSFYKEIFNGFPTTLTHHFEDIGYRGVMQNV